MIKTTPYKLGLLLCGLLVLPAKGQNFFPVLGGQRAGTSIFTFLKIGVSARAVGMGEAVIALNQDATSIYYNPATIAQFNTLELSATHVQWPANIKYDFASVTHQLTRQHYLGFSAGILHMAPMLETTEYQPHGTGNYFTFQDRFLAVTYGARMTDRFSFGITVKNVQENLAGLTMASTMLDLGTFYWTGFRSLRFSASLSHFGAQTKPEGTYLKNILNTDTGEETVVESDYEQFSPPTVFRVGVAMEILTLKTYTLTAALQLNHPVDNTENISTGMEYTFLKILSLRAGYKINKEEESFSLGAGLRLPISIGNLRVDYGYVHLDHLSDPKRLTIGLSL